MAHLLYISLLAKEYFVAEMSEQLNMNFVEMLLTQKHSKVNRHLTTALNTIHQNKP